MNLNTTPIKFLGIFLYISSMILIFMYILYRTFVYTPSDLSHPTILTIESGEGFQHINQKLRSLNIISNRFYFFLFAYMCDAITNIKSGEYQISARVLPSKLLEQLTHGTGQVQHRLTLIEGWHLQDLLTAIQENPILIKTLDYNDDLADQLNYPEERLDGLFLADTYFFLRGTTDRALLNRAYQELKKVLNEIWQERGDNLPYQRAYEALTMASIIEKETAIASERQKVSGVFVRRLQKGMRLQADPTVIYAVIDQYKQFDGAIKRSELKIDSPYNTYRYSGLPPSPIALVGRAAIIAALHPSDSDALYFVAKPDGSHHFSKNLREHNQAVLKYQR